MVRTKICLALMFVLFCGESLSKEDKKPKYQYKSGVNGSTFYKRAYKSYDRSYNPRMTYGNVRYEPHCMAHRRMYYNRMMSSFNKKNIVKNGVK